MNTKRRSLLLGLATLPALALAKAPAQPFVEVWKDAGCGCCDGWVKHLQADGFSVKLHDGGHATAREKAGIPQKLASCHTGLVGGYAVEGHVPAADIRRLLREKPQAIGLAVPGMKIGSPGMDGPEYGGRRDPYEVLLVLEGGATRTWASHDKA